MTLASLVLLGDEAECGVDISARCKAASVGLYKICSACFIFSVQLITNSYSEVADNLKLNEALNV